MNRFLTGIAAGLAIGYLTAPRSGKDTRQQLTDAANKQAEGLKDQWAKTTGQVSKLVEDVKSNTGIFSDEPNAFADMEAANYDKGKQFKNEYNNKVEDTADAAKAGVNKAEEALKL